MKTFPYSNIAAVALVGIFCLQAVLAIPRLSATSDESIHLASGYSYWKTRDFRMNPEHPPLAKLTAAIPLLALHPRFDTDNPIWQTGDGLNARDEVEFWGRISLRK